MNKESNKANKVKKALAAKTLLCFRTLAIGRRASEFGVEKERNGAKNVIDWRTK